MEQISDLEIMREAPEAGEKPAPEETGGTWLRFLRALRKLAEKTDGLAVPDENGALPPFTEEDREAVKALYGAAEAAAEEYLADGTPDAYPQYRKTAAAELRTFLAQDRAALEAQTLPGTAETDRQTQEGSAAGEKALRPYGIGRICELIETNDPGRIKAASCRELREMISEFADYDFGVDDSEDDLRRIEELKAKAACLRAARIAYQYQEKQKQEQLAQIERNRFELSLRFWKTMNEQADVLNEALDAVIGKLAKSMKEKTIDENEFINAKRLQKEGALMYPARDSEVHIVCTDKNGGIFDFKLKESYKGYSRVSRIKSAGAPDPTNTTVTGALLQLRDKLKKTDPAYIKNSKRFNEMMESVELLCKLHAADNLAEIPDYRKRLRNAYKTTLVKVEDYILDKAARLAGNVGGKPDVRGELRLELALNTRTLLNRAIKVTEKDAPGKEQHRETRPDFSLGL